MTLHKAVEQYIALKQSLGFRFHGQSVLLAAFSKAMGKVSLRQVKPRTVRAYLDGRGPVTRHWHYKWETLHPFYRYAMARGWVRRSPLPVHVPKLDVTFAAYVYTPTELRALLKAITPDPLSGLLYQGLRTFHRFHARLGCYRLERKLPGGFIYSPTGVLRLSTAHPNRLYDKALGTMGARQGWEHAADKSKWKKGKGHLAHLH